MNDILLVQIYVDDIIFGATNDYLCKEFSSDMQSEFEMSMMGELNFFLGLQIRQTKNGIFINQSKYCKELLKRGMIGSLLYLSASRPDIMFSVCLCARYQSNPKESHLSAVKRIMRYLLGTQNLVSWHSKKQNSVALSTAEAEYIAAGSCCAQILWMKQQLSDYGLLLDHIPIKCDNTSAINLSKNPVLHSRTKHIEIRHHFLRDHVQKGDCVLEFVETKSQLADIFTKPLPKENFFSIRQELEILDYSHITF
uniref:Copia protein n=1 Tax=Cajanus cajan TaxID=3821 RepID=A0A151SRL5_CAJCA|nr:Copia protein [Cajanus cajan]